MATTISEAARRWGIGRETIYRRRRAGRLNFATTEPPTVEASEMLRVFGEPKPKLGDGAGRGTVAALARLEATCELLKAEGERLKAELAAVKEELRDSRADARKERDRLLDLLAAQQKVLGNRVGESNQAPQRSEITELPQRTEMTELPHRSQMTELPQRSEMSEAEAVLAARQRAENEGYHRDR
jgi:hypothetical protein